MAMLVMRYDVELSTSFFWPLKELEMLLLSMSVYSCMDPPVNAPRTYVSFFSCIGALPLGLSALRGAPRAAVEATMISSSVAEADSALTR